MNEPLTASRHSSSLQASDRQAYDLGRDVYGEQAVRMPTLDDFPPMGQALLREQQRDMAISGHRHNAPEVRAGLETLKQRAGFLERLPGVAMVREVFGRKRQTVAQQPQIKAQLSDGQAPFHSSAIDPFVKGQALSPKTRDQHATSMENEEVTEFPSFLRKIS